MIFSSCLRLIFFFDLSRYMHSINKTINKVVANSSSCTNDTYEHGTSTEHELTAKSMLTTVEETLAYTDCGSHWYRYTRCDEHLDDTPAYNLSFLKRAFLSFEIALWRIAHNVGGRILAGCPND